MTPIAVSNLVQTVYIWGANKSLYAHYPYPYPKYLPQNVEKLLSVTYVRYWRHGIRVMPHKGSLIKRGDISKDTECLWTPIVTFTATPKYAVEKAY